jgi:hypothetical protein
LKGANEMFDTIANYFGGGDMPAAVLVSQKLYCPLINAYVHNAYGKRVPNVIQIGGQPEKTSLTVHLILSIAGARTGEIMVGDIYRQTIRFLI